MSANTTISEGGKGYPFGPVKCLMVEGDDGEFYPWYPEADRALDSLSVTQNGIYRASDRGVYGWDRVSVNVAQTDRVTGRDPDTGDEKTVTVDPGTGELVETVVPVEIRIETPPTFTGPYGNGAYIDFTGLTVAAYGANGDKMLDVPFNELIFPVTVTDVSKVEGGDERDVTGTDLIAPVYLTPLAVGMYYQNLKIFSVEGSPYGMRIHMGGNDYSNTIASFFPSSVTVARDDGSFAVTYRADTEFTYNGKMCYINTGNRGFDASGTLPVTARQNVGIGEAAGIALLGTRSLGGQPIPVQWQCPDSGEILETSFKIEVTNVSPNNNAGN